MKTFGPEAYIYAYIYTYIHIYIHTYIHTFRNSDEDIWPETFSLSLILFFLTHPTVSFSLLPRHSHCLILFPALVTLTISLPPSLPDHITITVRSEILMKTFDLKLGDALRLLQCSKEDVCYVIAVHNKYIHTHIHT